MNKEAITDDPSESQLATDVSVLGRESKEDVVTADASSDDEIWDGGQDAWFTLIGGESGWVLAGAVSIYPVQQSSPTDGVSIAEWPLA
ncbi:hypothetical protein EIP86_001389 [Pleurotus ostreatoroseus]|nr:hypothetical protein EIP86_001389 [Pleurotus ostreatoroseus]